MAPTFPRWHQVVVCISKYAQVSWEDFLVSSTSPKTTQNHLICITTCKILHSLFLSSSWTWLGKHKTTMVLIFLAKIISTRWNSLGANLFIVLLSLQNSCFQEFCWWSPRVFLVIFLEFSSVKEWWLSRSSKNYWWQEVLVVMD